MTPSVTENECITASCNPYDKLQQINIIQAQIKHEM